MGFRLSAFFGPVCGALLGALSSPLPARGCETALLLAIDVSGSIDEGEYRLQTDGLADALADPLVVEALVGGQDALAVVQWSGVGQQALVLPWTRMTDGGTVARFAAAARALPRAFAASDTAIGDAIAFSAAQFAQVPDCRRHVIDVSGDGIENAGSSTLFAHRAAAAQGVIVNGLAIESLGVTITTFYKRYVITPKGFVITARDHNDYPRAIRLKLQRELTKPLG
ncbi:DUF1194 domain-containing protein [Acidimangrovimonas pyrenivorans]|uniref:DUF1194 domain-containing protein n=1 Tax=Acidimangrovimonas pyrenivorans TaxID=2030798 RepID=A0ABV7AIK4_9RHOB